MHMQIFAGFPGEESSNDSGGVVVACQKRQFSVLSLIISPEALEVRPTLLYTVNRGNIVLPGNFERKLE